MKTDLITAAIATVIGFAIAFFVTSNVLIKDPGQTSVKTINSKISGSLDDVDEEIFNYRAINPTVEAYVDCTNYDASGNCTEKGQ